MKYNNKQSIKEISKTPNLTKKIPKKVFQKLDHFSYTVRKDKNYK